MADELVYRLILDGQDNTSGSGSGSSSGTRPKSGTAYDDQTQQNIIALEQARARIRREDAAELADQQYRSLKRGTSLPKIQDEDHQKKLDDAEADAQRVKDAAREEAERQRKAADRLRIQGEERQNRDEDWLAREEKRIQQEKATQQLHGEERQNRDEDWLARDQLRQRNEAMAEAERQRKAAQAADPSFLAQQAIEREKLFDQTRLQVEATKRGMTPEEVANEERQRESARNAAGGVAEGASAVRQITGGGVLSPISAVGSLSPIITPVTQTATSLIRQMGAFEDGIRKSLLDAGRFSPEVSFAQMKNEFEKFKQDLKNSQENGAAIAKKELEAGELDRRIDQAQLDISLQLGNISKKIEAAVLEGMVGGVARGVDIKQAAERVVDNPKPFEPPGPFEFRVQRLGHVPGVGGVMTPFVKPRGLVSPQMPGG